MKANLRIVLVCLSVAVFAAAGCKQKAAEAEAEKDADTGASKPQVTTIGVPAETGAELEVILVEADKLDGKQDRVVSKCAGCGLAMDGNPQHVVRIAGYNLNMCSEHCAKTFAEHAVDAIKALDIPKS